MEESTEINKTELRENAERLAPHEEAGTAPEPQAASALAALSLRSSLAQKPPETQAQKEDWCL